MSERECRTCGRVYRGCVCQACHPRRPRGARRAEIEAALRQKPAEIRAQFQEGEGDHVACVESVVVVLPSISPENAEPSAPETLSPMKEGEL